MSFDREYLTQMSYGGKGGNSIWHYNDYNADNVASLVSKTGTGTVNAAYFARAYTESGIVARDGDIILISSYATKATNSATPVIGLIPNTWDANGASVILAAGRFT